MKVIKFKKTDNHPGGKCLENPVSMVFDAEARTVCGTALGEFEYTEVNGRVDCPRCIGIIEFCKGVRARSLNGGRK